MNIFTKIAIGGVTTENFSSEELNQVMDHVREVLKGRNKFSKENIDLINFVSSYSDEVEIFRKAIRVADINVRILFLYSIQDGKYHFGIENINRYYNESPTIFGFRKSFDKRLNIETVTLPYIIFKNKTQLNRAVSKFSSLKSFI